MKKVEEKICWLNERIIELQNENIVRNQNFLKI
jgi:hypothetical protein